METFEKLLKLNIIDDRGYLTENGIYSAIYGNDYLTSYDLEIIEFLLKGNFLAEELRLKHKDIDPYGEENWNEDYILEKNKWTYSKELKANVCRTEYSIYYDFDEE